MKNVLLAVGVGMVIGCGVGAGPPLCTTKHPIRCSAMREAASIALVCSLTISRSCCINPEMGAEGTSLIVPPVFLL